MTPNLILNQFGDLKVSWEDIKEFVSNKDQMFKEFDLYMDMNYKRGKYKEKTIICNQCGIMQFHSLRFCPDCPGEFNSSYTGWTWKMIFDVLDKSKRKDQISIIAWCYFMFNFFKDKFSVDIIEESSEEEKINIYKIKMEYFSIKYPNSFHV